MSITDWGEPLTYDYFEKFAVSMYVCIRGMLSMCFACMHNVICNCCTMQPCILHLSCRRGVVFTTS